MSGKLRHGGHPVLTAAVMGAAVVSDPTGALKVDKGKSEGSASVPDRPCGRGYHGRRREARAGA